MVLFNKLALLQTLEKFYLSSISSSLIPVQLFSPIDDTIYLKAVHYSTYNETVKYFLTLLYSYLSNYTKVTYTGNSNTITKTYIANSIKSRSLAIEALNRYNYEKYLATYGFVTY